MILFPPAKINIGLEILAKRPDGYHEIVSCMYPVKLFDILEVLPAAETVFKQTGRQIPGRAEDNLCLKAHTLMKQNFGIGDVYIHLIKQIPTGAGLGGGSSDAAYTILALNAIFELGLDLKQMEALAAGLGSDCPFFIAGIPQMAKGRGELLTPVSLDLAGYFLKLIHPEVHIGTAEAYAGVRPNPKTLLEQGITLNPSQWSGNVSNQFEDSIFPRYPKLKEIKDLLQAEGALYASMSGSGSSVYGIYADKPELSPGYSNQWIVEL